MPQQSLERKQSVDRLRSGLGSPDGLAARAHSAAAAAGRPIQLLQYGQRRGRPLSFWHLQRATG